jgi:hypothetical protein
VFDSPFRGVSRVRSNPNDCCAEGNASQEFSMLPIRVLVTAGMSLLVVLLLPGASAAQTTALDLNSQEGDYIGAGIHQTFGPTDGTFTVFRNFNNGVAISFNGGPHWWNLNFAAPNNATLTPGVYDGATRWPFHSPTTPGLDVSGEGRGCNMLVGRFEVLEAVYSPSGEVVRFAATFEQHCEGVIPALLGSVLYNSTLPPPPPPPTECVSSVATLPALIAEVDSLAISPLAHNVLVESLTAAHRNLDHRRPRLARAFVAQFIWHAVSLSNLPARRPNSIPLNAANNLICGASNVMTNIALAD